MTMIAYAHVDNIRYKIECHLDDIEMTGNYLTIKSFWTPETDEGWWRLSDFLASIFCGEVVSLDITQYSNHYILQDMTLQSYELPVPTNMLAPIIATFVQEEKCAP